MSRRVPRLSQRTVAVPLPVCPFCARVGWHDKDCPAREAKGSV